MKKRLAAGLLCLLMVFQMSGPPKAQAADYIYFVAAGDNVLPLSDRTMPFWSGGYLYIASSIITGSVRDVLDISCIRNQNQKRLVLYSAKDAESLFFEWEKDYATDKEGNVYRPGAIYKNGEVFIPAALVARLFGLQYSVTAISTVVDGETVKGDLIWLRRPGHVLPASVFADAASSGAIPERYTDYIKGKRHQAAESGSEQPAEAEPVVEGRRIYLCMTAGEDTAALLDQLDQYAAQAAFFCTPEFMENNGALLRRMTATGQAIGILADGADPDRTAAEQIAAANRALEEATFGKTRLVYIQNGGEKELQAARDAGCRCLEPAVDRSGYQLHTVSNANSLLRRVSALRDGAAVWLGDTASQSGLRAFLSAVGNAEGQCLAWTETA